MSTGLLTKQSSGPTCLTSNDIPLTRSSISTSEEYPPPEGSFGSDAMSFSPKDTKERASAYTQCRGISICDRLGFGTQGTVFLTDRQSAIKVLDRELHYLRERDVYLRLREYAVKDVQGLSVPQLIDYDDALWVVEMTTVTPPYVIDFASAYLDTPPDYPEEVLADWHTEKKEQFGEDWPRIRSVVYAFDRYGIYLADVGPANICLRQ